jgi:hypothetical protein
LRHCDRVELNRSAVVCGLLAARDREARLTLCRRLLLPATVASRCPAAEAPTGVEVTPAYERCCPLCGSRRLCVRALAKESLSAAPRHGDTFVAADRLPFWGTVLLGRLARVPGARRRRRTA